MKTNKKNSTEPNREVEKGHKYIMSKKQTNKKTWETCLTSLNERNAS